MANFVASSAVDMTSIQIGAFASGTPTTHTATVYRVTNGSDFDELSGSGFTYNASDRLTGGTITGWTHQNVGGSTSFVLSAPLLLRKHFRRVRRQQQHGRLLCRCPKRQ